MKGSWRVRTRWLAATSLIGCLVATAPAALSGAASAHAPAMLTCSSVRVTEPSQYVLGCGSGTYVLSDLRWTSWRHTSARGLATFVYNTCSPTCAADHNVAYPARVTLSGVASTSRGLDFKKVSLRYRKGGRVITSTWDLPPFT